MKSRIIKNVKNTKFMRRFPGFNLGSLLVAVICTFLIIISTFTPIPQKILTIPQEALINPSGFFSHIDSIDKITKTFYYIPQIPVVIMIAAILGCRLGILSVIIYIIVGLAGFPVFAGGGGINYYMQHGFGYILGFIPGVYTSGNILASKSKPFLTFRAAIVGVTAVHLIGIIYLATVFLIKRESIFTIFGWIWQLSGMQFFNDIIFAIVAVLIGRFLRKALWVAMD
jgi:biotin transport system substrate-specific component